MKADKTLDCTGLFCPMPIANAKVEINKMKAEEILEVLADDPGFEKDLPVWCRITGNEFLGIWKEGSIYKGFVKKK